MSVRFRRRLRIARHVWFNLSKRVGSVSLGRKGITMNLNRKGRMVTTGQPGSGFSYRSTRQPWEQQSPPAQRGDLAVMLVCAIIAVVIIAGIILAGQ